MIDLVSHTNLLYVAHKFIDHFCDIFIMLSGQFLSLKAPFIVILCQRATKYMIKVSTFVSDSQKKTIQVWSDKRMSK